MVHLAMLTMAVPIALLGWWMTRLGRQWSQSRIPERNKVFGVRTSATLASDAAWAAGLMAAGRPMRRSGAALLATSVVGVTAGAVGALIAGTEAGVTWSGGAPSLGAIVALAPLVTAVPAINRAARRAGTAPPLVPSLAAVLDYHLHLWEHGPRPLDATLEQVAAYCARAQAEGVTEIAITEHFYRFRQADVVGPGWFDDDPNPALRAGMVTYVDHERGADLDHYVEVALAAKREGLPVVLGLEVDYFRDRMDRVAGLLDGYPFDVLLGSVHWLGAWGFDNREIPAFADEWNTRSVESVWHDYTTALEELADSGTCDVLAHPDLCKIFGHVPAVPDEFYDRMAEAAARSGMAAEVSSAGWRKPVSEAYPAPPLLARFKARGVPITTASDAHQVARVAERGADLRALVRSAGYDQLRAYAGRQPHDVAL